MQQTPSPEQLAAPGFVNPPSSNTTTAPLLIEGKSVVEVDRLSLSWAGQQSR
jgi:hypothetical protein